ncbi:glutathione S-transferase family protein [Amaricoccus solimangrovi]|uniref:Glutathione S-transferase family protein n=1 Tax=Amaricoccus solimangrovi TaxID=2589815 RepID=A0A501WHV9_9RHOB|nr:glutathione S-transferase family protein [Amaricoccus solimangrovi]TPE47694.1 glutathione S-transferase family protein [Amaricoccus solimangrovi]
MPTLYFSRNPNPRLAVATAKYLGSEIEFVWASPFDPASSERFRKLNPSLRVPILVEDGTTLWEADAIACRLSMSAGSTFWRLDPELPELIRWISWGKANFVHACDMVHFEFGTRQRYGLGPVDPVKVAEGEALFRASAAQLDAHLETRAFLLDSGLSYADFRMATFLPFNAAAGLPLADYPAISRWNDRLSRIPAWADPFAGLAAPELPFVPPRAR